MPTWAKMPPRAVVAAGTVCSGTASAIASRRCAPGGSPLLSSAMPRAAQDLPTPATKVSRPVSQSASLLASKRMRRTAPAQPVAQDSGRGQAWSMHQRPPRAIDPCGGVDLPAVHRVARRLRAYSWRIAAERMAAEAVALLLAQSAEQCGDGAHRAARWRIRLLGRRRSRLRRGFVGLAGVEFARDAVARLGRWARSPAGAPAPWGRGVRVRGAGDRGPCRSVRRGSPRSPASAGTAPGSKPGTSTSSILNLSSARCRPGGLFPRAPPARWRRPSCRRGRCGRCGGCSPRRCAAVRS